MAQPQQTPAPEAEQHRQPAQTIANVVALPLDTVRQTLPERGLPVYLGLGALTIANIIDWPIAVAAGLGYIALRGWKRPTTETS